MNKKYLKINSKASSFTLIEIIITVAILSLILLFSIINIPTQLRKLRDVKRKYDMYIIRNVLEDYYDSLNCYPRSLPDCGTDFIFNKNLFLSNTPCDPKLKTGYIYKTDSSNCSYWFRLYTNLEYKEDSVVDLVGCRFGCGPQCQYNYGVASPNTYLEICQPTPTITPTLTATPTSKPASPTPTPILYVCVPGGGPSGSCESFAMPTLSLCPKIYPNDPTCQNACVNNNNRCKDSKGKYKPTGY